MCACFIECVSGWKKVEERVSISYFVLLYVKERIMCYLRSVFLYKICLGDPNNVNRAPGKMYFIVCVFFARMYARKVNFLFNATIKNHALFVVDYLNASHHMFMLIRV